MKGKNEKKKKKKKERHDDGEADDRRHRCAFLSLSSCGFSAGNASRPTIRAVTFELRARFSFSINRSGKNNTVNR